MDFSPIYFLRLDTLSHPGGFKFQNPPQHEETEREAESRPQVSPTVTGDDLGEILTSHFQAEGDSQHQVTGGGHSRGQETSLRASRIFVYREPGADHQEGDEPCCDIDISNYLFLYTAHTQVILLIVHNTTHTLFFLESSRDFTRPSLSSPL